MTSSARDTFNAFYENGTPPWVIGEPQPAIIALEQTGVIRGKVLDPGCGTGEHTILLTRLGYDVLGIDYALFHVFGAPADRARYVASLHSAIRPDGVLHLLALSDAGRGFGPMVSEDVIREAFVDGWELEELDTTTYRGVVGELHSEALGIAAGTPLDEPAWLARVRRT